MATKLSAADSQEKLGQMPESYPNKSVFSPVPLSEIPQGCALLPCKQKTLESQRIEAL